MLIVEIVSMKIYATSRSSMGILFLLVATAVVTLNIACSSNEKVVEADKDSGTLVLYSGRSESLIGNIVDQFEDASGIDVQVKYGKTFPIAAMILEEGKNSPADIFFAQDPGGLGFLSAEGRLS